jgi:ubiquinone/menaquinone biosynthesis C-methylase UbiE
MGLKPSVVARMAEQQQRARTDEERHYYALNAKAWRLLAPFYDTIVFPLKRLRRDVAKLAGVGPGSRVLDVATGTGAQALAFAETGAEVVGIDLSESMLRIARRKAHSRNVTFRVADARELPFQDARFDVCCVSFGLHEMPVSVRQQALLDMARVTKKNGKLVIVDYALPENPIASKLVYHLVNLYERDNYAEFVRSDMHAMLDRAGLAARTEARVAPGAAMRWWSPAMIVIASKVEASNSNGGDVITD